MSRRFNPGFPDAKGIMMYAPGGPGIGGMFAIGTTVPADGTIGYVNGCIFIDRDAAAGANLWKNDGTYASSLFKNIGSKSGIVTASTTLTVTKTLHEGKTILLNLAAGFVTTLPAATGSGDKYRFVVNVIPTTSSTYVINAAGSDVFKGSLALSTPASTWATANIGETFASSTGVTITIGGSSSPKGGATIGDYVMIEDISSAVWQVSGWLTTGTTPTTPFS